MELDLATRRATRRLASALAPLLAAGDVVWLEGELGAGKTFFARGLLRALGVPASVPVTSPTFALVHEHEGRAPIRHLDLYRLGEPDEIVELGMEEALEDTIVVIEWGRRLRSAIGERGIEIALRPRANGGRAASVTGLDERGRTLAARLAADPRVSALRT